MKIYISSDMEGSTGVVSREQVDCTKPQYAFGRAMQEADIKAVVGALQEEPDVEEIIINDSHCTMTNIDIRGLGAKVSLISGTPKILGMMEGVGGCDAAIFLGYHAMAGTEKAVLDHTYDPDTIFDLSINGQKMGETGVNAILCGVQGVPVAMVSGDETLAMEAKSLLGPTLIAVAVKEGLARCAAKCETPQNTARALAEGAKAAIQNVRSGKMLPFFPVAPFVMDITLLNTLQTDAASLVPGAARVGARTLRFETNDALELRRFLYSVMECAGRML